MYRRDQAALQREREIMKDVKGWEVSQPQRCFGQTIDKSFCLPPRLLSAVPVSVSAHAAVLVRVGISRVSAAWQERVPQRTLPRASAYSSAVAVGTSVPDKRL